MKKITFFLLIVFSTILESKAQLIAQIGTDSLTTITLYSPFYRFGATSTTRWSIANIVYTQAELAAVGITNGATITSLEFNKANSGASTSPFSFQIKMANSTVVPPLATSTTWGSILASHTDVYNNSAYSLPATIGWIPFLLQIPFVYTGGSLEIATYGDFGTSPGNTTTAGVQWYHSPGTATSAIGAVGSTNPPNTTQTLSGITAAYKHRPNIRINYQAAAPCVSPPSQATIVTSGNDLCLGETFNLTLDSVTFGTGQTYQWETSTDSLVWSPIPNETNAFYLGTQTIAEAFYRNIVTCGGISTPSKGIKITFRVNSLSGFYLIDSSQVTSPGVFNSLDEAISSLNCVGVSGAVDFQLVAGTYAGNFSLANVPNPNNFPISFSSADANADSVIIIPSAPSTLFTITGVNNLSFGNITFRRTQQSTVAQDLIFATGTTGLSILNCKFEGTTASIFSANRLLHLVNSTGASVISSTFKDGYYGIHCPSVTGTSNIGLTISQNTFIDIYLHSIHIIGTLNNNVLIEGNTINSSNVTTTSTGMTLTGHDNLVVRNNRITGLLGNYAFDLTNLSGTASSPNLIYNNTVDVAFTSTATPRALFLKAQTGNGNDYLEFVHNSINMSISTTSITQSGAIYLTGGTPTAPLYNGIRIQNNIIKVVSTNATSTVPANFRAFYISNSYILDSNLLVSNNNILNIPTAVSFAYIAAPTPAITVASLSNWQSTYGLDSASLIVDPLFVGSGNLGLLPLSPANGLGAPISYVTTDINGNLRNATNPDAGALELIVNQNDVSLDTIISPSGSIPGGVATPISVRLVNFGTTTVTNLSLNYQFNNNPVVTEAFTGSLAFLDTAIFTFATTLTVPANATSTNLVVWISGPNGQLDQNTSNDTISQSLCIAISGGTYSVGNTTSDFPDVSAFLNRLNCGGITGPVVFNFDFPTDTLNQQVLLGNIPGASATNTILFNGNNQIISFEAVTGNRGVVVLDGTKQLEIRNFHIRSSATGFGFGIQLMNDASNNRIVGNFIDLTAVTSTTAANSAGITSAALPTTNITPTTANNNVIDSNQITGGFYGIRLNGTAGSTNTSYGNIISNNIITDFYNHGVYLLGTDSNIVRGNDINRLTRTNNVIFYGVNLEAGNQNVIVDGNRIHDSHTSATALTTAAYGVRITTSSPTAAQSNKVFNNLVYNLNSNSTTNGVLIVNSANAEVYFNTLSIDNVAATAGDARGIYYQGTVSNMTARNNNITLTKGGTGEKQGIYIENLASTVISNNNNIYLNSLGTGIQAVGNRGGTTNNFVTLADWQGAGFDSSSFSVDPQYINLASGDLTPQSAVLNASAFPISYITTDFNRVTRNATPDIGAIEFSPVNIDVAIGNIFNLQNGSSNQFSGGCVSSLSQTIQVEIVNSGLDTINSVIASFRLNSGTVITETVNGPFVTGTTTLYTFNAPVVFSANLDTLTVWVSNAGDINKNNDTTIVSTQYQLTLFITVPYTNNFESASDLASACTTIGPNAKLEILGTVGANNLAINGNSSLVFSGSATGSPWSVPTAANWDVLNPNSNATATFFVRADTLSRLAMKFRLQQLYRSSAVNNNFRVLINDVPATPIGYTSSDFRPANTAASSDTLDLEYNLDAFVGDTVKITFLTSVRYDYTGSPLNATIIDGLQIFQPTQPSLDSITIATNECFPTSKLIAAEVNFVLPASSVELLYQVNNASFQTVAMTLNVGTGFYTGTIPAQNANDTVKYFVRATDNQNNVTISDTLNYVDDYIVLNAGPDQTIVLGSSATLVVNSNIGGGTLLITEIMYFRGGGADGRQTVFPSYLPAADDIFEISNTGGSPISLSGKKFTAVYNTTQLDLIFPAGAVLQGGSVALILPGPGTNDIANNLYYMGGANNNIFQSSSNPACFVLYDNNNDILDVMKYGASPFPANLGVSSSDWTGSINGNTSHAALIRSGEDTNDASDWSLSGPANITSIGNINPTLIITSASAIEWFNLAGTSLGTGDTLVVSPTITTSYVAVVTDGNCTKRDTVVVTVTSNQVVDATIESIITPVTGVPVNSATPVKVVVRNVGTLPISGGFDLVYTVNGVTTSQQGFGNTIAVGDTAQLTFNTPWAPTQGGNYELCVRAIVPNDVNANNDTICANFTSSVSVNNIAGNSFKVYPNPATDFVVLEFNDPLFGTTSIQIIDIAGRLQQQNIVTESTNRFEIRLSNLQEGIYQVRIINSLGTSTSQLFIRK